MIFYFANFYVSSFIMKKKKKKKKKKLNILDVTLDFENISTR